MNEKLLEMLVTCGFVTIVTVIFYILADAVHNLFGLIVGLFLFYAIWYLIFWDN